MKLQVKKFNIRTDTPLVVVIHRTDAIHYDLHTTDRVEVKYKNKRAVAIVDILDHRENPKKAGIMQHGMVGLFEETAEALGVPDGATITISPRSKPESLKHIKNKVDGKALAQKEIFHIVEDIVNGELTDIELTSFITAVAIRGMTFEEITYLTKAVATTGDCFSTRKRPVIDKHCIGGVPGNRTTMVVTPIMACLGFTMPKTSSRAITSPSGTADTMECLADVCLDLKKMKSVVDKAGACMVWGGAMGLAPADDKIIRIERPLSIDVTSLMLSSVMAKKYSVGATHVIIDIPYGKGAKIETLKEAKIIREHFLTIGKLLGMQMIVLLTDGKQPIGSGIGPLLEAIDVMKVLRDDEDASQDLKEKSIFVAGELLEFVGGAQKGKGKVLVREVLESGKALAKMEEMRELQGRVELEKLSKFTFEVKAKKKGKVSEIKNKTITKLSRLAGAPVTKTAGLYMYKKVGDYVKKDETLFRVYCGSAAKVKHVKNFLEEENPYVI